MAWTGCYSHSNLLRRLVHIEICATPCLDIGGGRVSECARELGAQYNCTVPRMISCARAQCTDTLMRFPIEPEGTNSALAGRAVDVQYSSVRLVVNSVAGSEVNKPLALLLMSKQCCSHLLQLCDGRVFTKHIISNLCIGHCLSHGRAGLGQCITAQVNTIIPLP